MDPRLGELGSNIITQPTLSVYPNPSNGNINYSLSLDEFDRVVDISILDMSGQVIDRIDFEQSTERFINGTHSFEDQLAGLYIIRVQLDSEVITEKVMIVK